MSLISLDHLSPQTNAILRASNSSDSTLLITGSTGTGKSHLAFELHRQSRRGSTSRWNKINLATLSENLIESELFGHERGAFTGADSKRLGKLELCNGGTIFLDEIGELPIRLQGKLLDFIQYKKICPVGANREITLDVRIIAATNKNLEAAVKRGEFRADLFHRLNVFHVWMPDLALNPKAVLDFAHSFLEKQNEKLDRRLKGFAKEVESIFRLHTWPGNIRELENVIEFSAAMEGGDFVRMASLPPYLQSLKAVESEVPALRVEQQQITVSDEQNSAVGMLNIPISLDFHNSRDKFERAYIEHALKICGGQINLTSRRIGLNKVSLSDKIKRHSIDWRKIRYDAVAPIQSNF